MDSPLDKSHSEGVTEKTKGVKNSIPRSESGEKKSGFFLGGVTDVGMGLELRVDLQLLWV